MHVETTKSAEKQVKFLDKELEYKHILFTQVSPNADVEYSRDQALLKQRQWLISITRVQPTSGHLDNSIYCRRDQQVVIWITAYIAKGIETIQKQRL